MFQFHVRSFWGQKLLVSRQDVQSIKVFYGSGLEVTVVSGGGCWDVWLVAQPNGSYSFGGAYLRLGEWIMWGGSHKNSTVW
jgi:hypothetical protein